jgi:hypothetical protein
MEAGKQPLWSWAVKGSPHRCSPDPGSLAAQGVDVDDRLQGTAFGRFLPIITVGSSRSDGRAVSTLTPQAYAVANMVAGRERLSLRCSAVRVRRLGSGSTGWP